MEFYFGEVKDEDVIDSERDELFTPGGGRYYYYKFELDEDGFRFMDTCGRMIPIDYEAVQEMNTAMFGVTKFIEASEGAQKLFEDQIQQLAQVMDLYKFKK